MVARRRWSELSERNRRLIVLGSLIEGLLKIVALADLRRRPAEQIRGPKWAWAVVVALVNAVGGAPLAYFLFGRRSALSRG
jgi:hypothetical protein